MTTSRPVPSASWSPMVKAASSKICSARVPAKEAAGSWKRTSIRASTCPMKSVHGWRRRSVVAGVFSTKAAADAAMAKIKSIGPQLAMVDASNILVIVKDEAGKVEVNTLDIGSASGVDIMAMAGRVTADIEALGAMRRVAPQT